MLCSAPLVTRMELGLSIECLKCSYRKIIGLAGCSVAQEMVLIIYAQNRNLLVRNIQRFDDQHISMWTTHS